MLIYNIVRVQKAQWAAGNNPIELNGFELEIAVWEPNFCYRGIKIGQCVTYSFYWIFWALIVFIHSQNKLGPLLQTHSWNCLQNTPELLVHTFPSQHEVYAIERGEDGVLERGIWHQWDAAKATVWRLQGDEKATDIYIMMTARFLVQLPFTSIPWLWHEDSPRVSLLLVMVLYCSTNGFECNGVKPKEVANFLHQFTLTFHRHFYMVSARKKTQ